MKVLFVVGVSRSGTKLLRSLLSNHSNIILDDVETHFLPKLYKKYSDLDLSNYNIFKKFYNDFMLTSYCYHKGNFVLGLDEWFASCYKFTFDEIYSNFYKINLNVDNNIIYYGDKTPMYLTQIKELVDIFPNACFIHIIRDPRDRAISVNKTWGRNLYKAAIDWSINLKKFHKQKHLINEENLYEIYYEDLLKKPDQELSKLLNFLQLPFENINYLTKKTEKYGEAKDSYSIKVDNINKFHNELEKDKIKKIEEFTFDMLNKYRYTVYYANHEAPISKKERIKYYAHDRIKRKYFHIKDKGLVKGLYYLSKNKYVKRVLLPFIKNRVND